MRDHNELVSRLFEEPIDRIPSEPFAETGQGDEDYSEEILAIRRGTVFTQDSSHGE